MSRLHRSAVGVVAAACCLTAVVVPATDASAAAKAKTYKNCTALNHVYKHGVGKVHAHDHTTGKPVTTFKRSNALYAANKKSDRDKDGIACEKR